MDELDIAILLSKLIYSMREFQKQHNITSQCITNAQTLYDIMKHYTNVKVRAVMVFSVNDTDGSIILVQGHLVLVIDDKIIEPSYDVYSLKNKIYFDKIKDFVQYCQKNEILNDTLNFQLLFKEHITFMKTADDMNHDKFGISNMEYYNNQIDYLKHLYGCLIYEYV